nr:hypothetical protein [Nonlabens ulvanivorans]
MEIKYCWRCKMEIPMLDKEEFAIASELYSKGFKIAKKDRQEKFKELLDYYNELTGFRETEPNSIMHHSLEQIGLIARIAENHTEHQKRNYVLLAEI